ADHAAVFAFDQSRTGFAALAMHRTFGAAIGVERPLDRVFDEAVEEYCAAVIEHDGIGLGIGRTQDAPDHLPIQAHLARWSRENAATDVGHVPALGEHHAVADNIEDARFQPRQRGIA